MIANDRLDGIRNLRDTPIMASGDLQALAKRAEELRDAAELEHRLYVIASGARTKRERDVWQMLEEAGQPVGSSGPPPADAAMLASIARSELPADGLDTLRRFCALHGLDPHELTEARQRQREASKALRADYRKILAKGAKELLYEVLDRRRAATLELEQRYFWVWSADHRNRLDLLHERLWLYVTLTSGHVPEMPPTLAESFRTRSDLPDPATVRRVPVANATTGWVRIGDSGSKNGTAAAKHAALAYSRQTDIRSAVNALYFEEPILLFLRRRSTPLLLTTFSPNQAQARDAYTVRMVKSVIPIAQRSFQTFSKVVDEILTHKPVPKWHHVRPALIQVANTLHVETGQDPTFLMATVDEMARDGAEDPVGDVLTALTYAGIAVAIILAPTPFGLAAAAFDFAAGITSAGWQFAQTLQTNDFRFILKSETEMMGLLAIAESPEPVADDVAMIVIELIFAMPALRSVALTRRLERQSLHLQSLTAEQAQKIDRLKATGDTLKTYREAVGDEVTKINAALAKASGETHDLGQLFDAVVSRTDAFFEKVRVQSATLFRKRREDLRFKLKVLRDQRGHLAKLAKSRPGDEVLQDAKRRNLPKLDSQIKAYSRELADIRLALTRQAPPELKALVGQHYFGKDWYRRYEELIEDYRSLSESMDALDRRFVELDKKRREASARAAEREEEIRESVRMAAPGKDLMAEIVRLESRLTREREDGLAQLRHVWRELAYLEAGLRQFAAETRNQTIKLGTQEAAKTLLDQPTLQDEELLKAKAKIGVHPQPGQETDPLNLKFDKEKITGNLVTEEEADDLLNWMSTTGRSTQ